MDAIDRAALDAQTGGDAGLAREVLALFAGQCRAILPRLLDPSLPAGQAADLAHTLKGSAAGVGATRVQALCGAVEARLRADARARPAKAAPLDAAPLDAPPLDDLAEAVAAALREIARAG